MAKKGANLTIILVLVTPVEVSRQIYPSLMIIIPFKGYFQSTVVAIRYIFSLVKCSLLFSNSYIQRENRCWWRDLRPQHETTSGPLKPRGSLSIGSTPHVARRFPLCLAVCSVCVCNIYVWHGHKV